MLPLLARVEEMRAARLFHPPGVVGGNRVRRAVVITNKIRLIDNNRSPTETFGDDDKKQ